ncbi:interleukin-22 receptor subunit alpha-1 isoform X2 [Calypte anna]|uniref:interleukin-22 receptor subunit alpha-1 isoform X2 n=1 Tax=Calypte anna TaxID=9244 RepID=UPI0011C3BCD4|nr:interleukin-22 receptor subunit alpha-1 isoform X2 [Calypte anna]
MKQYLVVLAVFSVVGIVTTEVPPCVKRPAFSSTNFENILTWETEADISPGTVFDVQYKEYGGASWLNKSECQGITQPFCNLTRETENFTEHYYARVRASGQNYCSSSWVCSDRFEARQETIIGAPEVEYIPSVRSIKFLIQPPYTPLRDNTWLLYWFVLFAFCAGLAFAAVSYILYKYIKQHSAQPTSLDFRGISSFQPLTLTVEHIIKPFNLTIPSLFIPEMQLPQISQHLDRALEPPESFHPPEGAYQDQPDVLTFQLPSLASTAPGYAPQTAQQSLLVAPSSTTLPLTYGVCGESMDHADKRSLQPNQTLKEVSLDSSAGGSLITQVLGESCSCYKEQRPKLALQYSRDTRALSQGSPGQIQQLLLQTEGMASQVYISQLQESQETEMLAGKELNCMEQKTAMSQGTLSEQDNGTLLTKFFKYLDLKVAGDQDENTELY